MPASFIVQTDDGATASANAYISLAYFKQYFLDRGKDVSALADAVIQTGIVLATDYIDMRWRIRFAGQRLLVPDSTATPPLTFLQSTQWPRKNVTDEDGFDITGLPEVLKRACAEYSLRAAQSSLLVDAPAPIADGERQPTGAVTSTSVTVGPISTRKTYTEGNDGPLSGTITTDQCLLPEIPAADMLIEQLLDPSSVQRRTVRA